MNKFIILGAIIVLAALAFWSLSKPKQKPQFQSVDEMMQYLASEAVDMASKHNGIVLNYSEESIKDVEKILGTIHEEYRASRSEEGVKGLAMAYGAYIGEVMRRGAPGSKWERDHPVAGEKSYPLHWLGGESFPCGWCYKRIIDGPDDNVWFKYTVLKQRIAEKKSASGKQ